MKSLSLAAASFMTLLIFMTGSQPHAQTAPPETVRVVTRPVAPFVVREDKRFTGFSMELREASGANRA